MITRIVIESTEDKGSYKVVPETDSGKDPHYAEVLQVLALCQEAIMLKIREGIRVQMPNHEATRFLKGMN